MGLSSPLLLDFSFALLPSFVRTFRRSVFIHFIHFSFYYFNFTSLCKQAPFTLLFAYVALLTGMVHPQDKHRGSRNFFTDCTGGPGSINSGILCFAAADCSHSFDPSLASSRVISCAGSPTSRTGITILLTSHTMLSLSWRIYTPFNDSLKMNEPFSFFRKRG